MTVPKATPLPDWADGRALLARAEDAARAADPESLVALVRVWFDEGLEEGHVLGVLETLRASFRERGLKSGEDHVMEVMDRLSGWCSPGAVLRKHRNA